MNSIPRPAMAPAIVLLAVLTAGVVHAQVQDPILYSLERGSVFENGCFGPCDCLVRTSGPMKGAFTFYRTSVDPLYQHYALVNIDWIYTQADSATGTPRVVHVTGHGTYDVGGEVALLQRLTLDVMLDARGPLHFDSGLGPVLATFPAFDATAFLHGNACLDSAFRVIAGPFGSGSVGPGSGGTKLLQAVLPNPSSRDVLLTFGLPRVLRTRVDVLDLGGRSVAHLLDAELDAGEHQIRWDGRDTRGTDLGPGVFWVRVRAGSVEERRRIVRVR